MEARPAHLGDITAIKVFKDGHKFATRGMDDAMKLWDNRILKQPINSFAGLMNLNEHTNIAISPDQRLIVTGTSSKKQETYGELVFGDCMSGEIVKRMPICMDSVVSVAWCASIN